MYFLSRRPTFRLLLWVFLCFSAHYRAKLATYCKICQFFRTQFLGMRYRSGFAWTITKNFNVCEGWSLNWHRYEMIKKDIYKHASWKCVTGISLCVPVYVLKYFLFNFHSHSGHIRLTLYVIYTFVSFTTYPALKYFTLHILIHLSHILVCMVLHTDSLHIPWNHSCVYLLLIYNIWSLSSCYHRIKEAHYYS